MKILMRETCILLVLMLYNYITLHGAKNIKTRKQKMPDLCALLVFDIV